MAERDSSQTWTLVLDKVLIFPISKYLQTRRGHLRQKWTLMELLPSPLLSVKRALWTRVAYIHVCFLVVLSPVGRALSSCHVHRMNATLKGLLNWHM